MLPESEVIQLGLEIDQLICYFSGVTAWPDTPDTEKQRVVLDIER